MAAMPTAGPTFNGAGEAYIARLQPAQHNDGTPRALAAGAFLSPNGYLRFNVMCTGQTHRLKNLWHFGKKHQQSLACGFRPYFVTRNLYTNQHKPTQKE
jgi:hypothetical protein